MNTMQARRIFWERHVECWRASGLTQVAYCQRHELKAKALAYWLRRDRQATASQPLTLVPVVVQPEPVAGELRLQHRNG